MLEIPQRRLTVEVGPNGSSRPRRDRPEFAKRRRGGAFDADIGGDAGEQQSGLPPADTPPDRCAEAAVAGFAHDMVAGLGLSASTICQSQLSSISSLPRSSGAAASARCPAPCGSSATRRRRHRRGRVCTSSAGRSPSRRPGGWPQAGAGRAIAGAAPEMSNPARSNMPPLRQRRSACRPRSPLSDRARSEGSGFAFNGAWQFSLGLGRIAQRCGQKAEAAVVRRHSAVHAGGACASAAALDLAAALPDGRGIGGGGMAGRFLDIAIAGAGPAGPGGGALSRAGRAPRHHLRAVRRRRRRSGRA